MKNLVRMLIERKLGQFPLPKRPPDRTEMQNYCSELGKQTMENKPDYSPAAYTKTAEEKPTGR